MSKPKTRKPRAIAAAWFASFPLIDPPGWDDHDGWCRRHFAPLAGIPDPAQRDAATRLASLELNVTFAAELRARVDPLPVPARKLTRLVRALAPVCCWIDDEPRLRSIIEAAIDTAAAIPA